MRAEKEIWQKQWAVKPAIGVCCMTCRSSVQPFLECLFGCSFCVQIMVIWLWIFWFYCFSPLFNILTGLCYVLIFVGVCLLKLLWKFRFTRVFRWALSVFIRVFSVLLDLLVLLQWDIMMDCFIKACPIWLMV